MLELKPNCECCDKDLPPESTEAYICSYECTFCTYCVVQKLFNVCPNCGGGLSRRPIRPRTQRRPGVSLSHQPASDKRVHSQYSDEEIAQFASATKSIPAEDR
ncbi:MAG: DUF1272 domain-containing protein [Pseudohongiellaceae bacterium]